MTNFLKVACIQITSGEDLHNNLSKIESFIRQAASLGASFVATPENTCYLKAIDSHFEINQNNDEEISLFSDLAKELGIFILVGSIFVKASDNKAYNRSFLFSNNGDIAATYDKIHLFDVNLETGESHRESDYIKAGNKAVITPINNEFILGMSICYDLRFPYLYRDLAQKGANILSVPAAFTVPTGKAHWEILLRARAIETGSYIVAPAQVGEHDGGRKTYGHSMIVNPWGEILAQKEIGQGVITANIDIEQVNKARTTIPSLKWNRNYIVNGM